MAFEAENIVTVNAGSSSIKLAVFSRLELQRIVDISVSDVGRPMVKLRIIQSEAPTKTTEVRGKDFAYASLLAIEELRKLIDADSVAAIGHRLVHSGDMYDGPTQVRDIHEDDWEVLSRLDPIHTPAARQLIRQFAQHYPATTQVACFDTSFFQGLPKVAKILPIPRKYYETGVRRYGFHGLAYTSVLAAFRERAGEEAANGRVIMAHLGSGASLAATWHGTPLDTTMSLTPASGVVMSTRSGDLDPGLFDQLRRYNDMRFDEFERMVNSESGLLGVSGFTGDMYSLLQVENENENAAMAIDLFVRSIKKAIGASSALLSGVDSLIFSGGIGEQSAPIRARICRGLEYLGIEIDETANQNNEFLISSANSQVGVHVVPADEASVIAEQTMKATGGKDGLK